MSPSRLAASTFFPLRYDRAVFAPAALLVAAFFIVEEVLHGSMSHRRSLVSNPVWDTLYAGAYAFYFLPLLLPALRAERGEIRRLLSGFALLILLGTLGVLASPLTGRLELLPCFQAAAALFVLAAVARTRAGAPTALAACAYALVALATYLTQRHGALDILIGSGVGWAAYKIVYSRDFDFLRDESPWKAVLHELGELGNLLLMNRRETWDKAYAEGHWEFLNETRQRPRHYAIAGIVADGFPKGARVLDIGCGLGTLLPILGPSAAAYTGLDLSSEAVERCRKIFGESAERRFVAGAFEQFQPGEEYDVVVINEVLYYFPLSRSLEIFRRAMSLVNDNGLLIVSMNKNLKAAMIWSRLNASELPEQSIRVTNLKTGSYWTVCAYRRGKT